MPARFINISLLMSNNTKKNLHFYQSRPKNFLSLNVFHCYLKIFVGDFFLFFWRPSESCINKPVKVYKISFFYPDACLNIQLSNFYAALHKPLVLCALHQSGIYFVALIKDFPYNFFYDIFNCNQADNLRFFIDDNCHVNFPVLKNVKHPVNFLVVKNKQWLFHYLPYCNIQLAVLEVL